MTLEDLADIINDECDSLNKRLMNRDGRDGYISGWDVLQILENIACEIHSHYSKLPPREQK